MRRDWHRAELTVADRGMLEFVGKLTTRPGAMGREDVEALRRHGFSDIAIHDIVQVAALFAYYNRIAEGLGIDPEPEWGWPGRAPGD